MCGIKQIRFGFDPVHKKTRNEVFLQEMDRAGPWAQLVALITPHARGAHQALGARPPFTVEMMLRIHCLQLWWNLTDPVMQEELHERPLYRRFAGLAGASMLPDEATILRFRHLLKKHSLTSEILKTINAGLTAQGLMLRTGTLMDATLIAAPSSTKNSTCARDPETHQTNKGHQRYIGMKAHKREEAQDASVNWHVALRPGNGRVLDKNRASQHFIDALETIKARIRAKVEHPFRVIKQQFGFSKVRYRGLAKNTARLNMLYALSSRWMAHKIILQGGLRVSMA